MSGPAQVIIVGEDEAHVGSLYRAVVDHLNIPRGKVRKRRLAQGRGDAKQYVLGQVPTEIKLLRRGPRSAVLIIAMDGDGISADQRIQQIAETLSNINTDPIDASEHIAIVVPCRNTETWLEFARCQTVDEVTDYKTGRQAAWTRDDLRLVGALLGQTTIPKENPPPSLDEARSELLEKIRPT